MKKLGIVTFGTELGVLSGDGSRFEYRKGNAFLQDFEGIFDYTQEKKGELLPVSQAYD